MEFQRIIPCSWNQSSDEKGTITIRTTQCSVLLTNFEIYQHQRNDISNGMYNLTYVIFRNELIMYELHVTKRFIAFSSSFVCFMRMCFTIILTNKNKHVRPNITHFPKKMPDLFFKFSPKIGPQVSTDPLN